MDLKPEQVYHEGHNEQPYQPSSKMLCELWEFKSTLRSIDVEELPEVDGNRASHSEESEDPNILRGDHAAQGHSGEQKPFPPLACERFMSPLVEFDVTQHAQ